MHSIFLQCGSHENKQRIFCGHVAYSKCHHLAIATFLVAGVTSITYGALFSAHLITSIGSLLTLTSLFYTTLLCDTPLSLQNRKKLSLENERGSEENDELSLIMAKQRQARREFLTALQKDTYAFISKYGESIVDAIDKNTFFKTFGMHWGELKAEHKKIFDALLDNCLPIDPLLMYFFQHPSELTLAQGELTSLIRLFNYLVEKNFNFTDFFLRSPLDNNCSGLLIVAFRHYKTMKEQNIMEMAAMLTHENNRQLLSHEILEAPIDVFDLLSEDEIVIYYGMALIKFFALADKTGSTEVPGTGKAWSQFRPYKGLIQDAFRHHFWLLNSKKPALSQTELLSKIENFKY